MSFNFAIISMDAESAKADLAANANAKAAPESVHKAINDLIESMPESVEGYRSINIAAYGHFASEDNPGTSNVAISISYQADIATSAA